MDVRFGGGDASRGKKERVCVPKHEREKKRGDAARRVPPARKSVPTRSGYRYLGTLLVCKGKAAVAPPALMAPALWACVPVRAQARMRAK